MQRSQGTVTALCLKLNRGDIEITKRVFWRRRRKWYVFCIKWKLGKSPSPRLGFKPMTLWDSNPQISSGAPIVSIDAKNVLFSSSSSQDSLGNLMVASLICLNVTAWYSSARSRPWDKGGCSLQKNFLRPFGPQFGLKIRGRGRPPRPLPWIHHCAVQSHTCLSGFDYVTVRCSSTQRSTFHPCSPSSLQWLSG